MTILALDLATHTGWAHNVDTDLKLGTWALCTDTEVRNWSKERLTRRNDPRVSRLFNFLTGFRDKIDHVVFEDVQFQSYTQACQLWSSLRAAVWLAFGGSSAIIECVPVMTLKKFATGFGVATKSMMMAAAVRDSKNRLVVGCMKGTEIIDLIDRVTNEHIDDNAADAYHLYRWAQMNLGRMIHRTK